MGLCLFFLVVWYVVNILKDSKSWFNNLFYLDSELFIVDLVQWHMIRAAQMLVAMRAISIGFQLDDKSLTNLPHPLPYFGYLYYVGTAAFGPWIPFKDYLNVENNKHSVIQFKKIIHLQK